MTGGDWIHEAMCDDSLVAEALICLLHAEPSPPETKSGGASDLKLKWTVRQRRTKLALLRKKGDHNTRASPTTPLSWSGATSFSGGGGFDGFEDSSGAVKLSEAVRSKGHFRQGSASSPVTQSCPSRSILRLRVDHKISLCYSGRQTQRSFFFIETQISSLLISQTSVKTTPFKRSRKKKTLAQLKEEESLLLKERQGLKNELASMRNLLKQQRARNESLKKLQAESQKNDDSSFLLPDLNIPLESL